MKQIPLSAQPSQTLQVVLANQNVQLAVYTKTSFDAADTTFQTPSTNLYMDAISNGVTLTTTAIARNLERVLIDRQYLGFVGDFMFVDQQGDADPQYTGLGTRWILVYLEASDIPTPTVP